MLKDKINFSLAYLKGIWTFCFKNKIFCVDFFFKWVDFSASFYKDFHEHLLCFLSLAKLLLNKNPFSIFNHCISLWRTRILMKSHMEDVYFRMKKNEKKNAVSLPSVRRPLTNTVSLCCQSQIKSFFIETHFNQWIIDYKSPCESDVTTLRHLQ